LAQLNGRFAASKLPTALPRPGQMRTYNALQDCGPVWPLPTTLQTVR